MGVSDMAAHASSLIVVGLYPHDSAASNAYILGHSGARLVLLDSEARSAVALAVSFGIPVA